MIDRHIRQHHERSGLFVLELLGTIPFLPDPSTDPLWVVCRESIVNKTYVSLNNSLKYSFENVIRENVQGPTNPDLTNVLSTHVGYMGCSGSFKPHTVKKSV